jgi:hypothetical protein
MSDETIDLLRWALNELSESVYDDRGLTLDEYYSEDRRWGTGDFETYQRAKALIGGSGVAPRDGDAPAPASQFVAHLDSCQEALRRYREGLAQSEAAIHKEYPERWDEPIKPHACEGTGTSWPTKHNRPK